MSRGGVSQQEFIAQFWSEMQKCVREGGKCTQVEVFNQLNAEFESNSASSLSTFSFSAFNAESFCIISSDRSSNSANSFDI